MSMSPAFSVVVPDVDPLLEVANVSPRTPSVSAAPVVSPAMAAFSVANFTVPVPTNKPMEQTAIVGSTLRQNSGNVVSGNVVSVNNGSANNGSANAPAKPANADLN